MLRAIAREDCEEPSDRVEQEVMYRWGRRHTGSPWPLDEAGSRRAPSTSSSMRRARIGVGIAACLMLSAWGATRLVPEPRDARPMMAADAPAEDMLTAASEPMTIVEPAAPEPPRSARPGRRAVRRATAAMEPAHRIESFTSLQPLSDADLLGVRMARVRLSAPAAERLGLVDIRLGTEESIEADVLLGEDGMARAIRIVR
jgi:hypothetical protein